MNGAVGNGQEIILPNWIDEDNTHGDKGQIQYIEKWGLKRRFRNPILISFYLFGLAFGIFLIIPPYGDFTFIQRIFSIFIGIYLAISSGIQLNNHINKMPLLIYNNGISHIEVKNAFRLKRKEVFSPWDEVREVRHIPLKSGGINDRKVTFDLGPEIEYTWNLNMISIFLNDKDLEFINVLRLLNEKIPEKVFVMCNKHPLI